MMSTEFSAQPSSAIASAASTSIVEVETDESLFKLREQRGQHRLHQRPPSTELEDDSEDKLMMTEYDEDNVIVIDNRIGCH